jgi:DNA primase
MLQNAGALTIVCTFDNDDAGRKAMKRIEQDLTHYFRMYCVTPETVNDVGDMFSDDISSQIGPILQQASRAEMLSDGYAVENVNG